MVAASLMGVQGLVLLLLAALEAASTNADRASLALSTAAFFAAYGAILVVGAFALWRRSAWARGPMLITQLIMLGLAWSLRDHVLVALALGAVAVVALAGALHPDTITALAGADPEDERPAGPQTSDSND